MNTGLKCLKEVNKQFNLHFPSQPHPNINLHYFVFCFRVVFENNKIEGYAKTVVEISYFKPPFSLSVQSDF